MKWSPFFSSLLKSRAALLQPPDPKTHDTAPTMPLLEPNFFSAPSEPSQIVRPEAPSQPAAAPAHSLDATSPSHLKNKADEAATLEPVTRVKLEEDSEPKSPTLTIINQPEDKTPPVALVPKLNQNVTLPLVRSKTGRLILPSSLKPRKLRVDILVFNICIIISILIYFILFFPCSHSCSGLLHHHLCKSDAEGRG